MWKRLTVVNWNLLGEGSAALVGSFPMGCGEAVTQVSAVFNKHLLPLWFVGNNGLSPHWPASPSQTSRNTNNVFIHGSRTLSRGKGALKVKRGCSYQDRRARVSHWSQKLVPVTAPAIRADHSAGRSSQPSGDCLCAERPEWEAGAGEDGEVLGTISVLRALGHGWGWILSNI